MEFMNLQVQSLVGKIWHHFLLRDWGFKIVRRRFPKGECMKKKKWDGQPLNSEIENDPRSIIDIFSTLIESLQKPQQKDIKSSKTMQEWPWKWLKM